MNCVICREPAVLIAKDIKDSAFVEFGLCRLHAVERWRPHKFLKSDCNVSDIIKEFNEAARRLKR